MKWVDSSRCDLNQRESSGNIFDSNLELSDVFPIYRIFAPNCFNLKIIFALSIFENIVASKIFH